MLQHGTAWYGTEDSEKIAGHFQQDSKTEALVTPAVGKACMKSAAAQPDRSLPLAEQHQICATIAAAQSTPQHLYNPPKPASRSAPNTTSALAGEQVQLSTLQFVPCLATGSKAEQHPNQPCLAHKCCRITAPTTPPPAPGPQHAHRAQHAQCVSPKLKSHSQQASYSVTKCSQMPANSSRERLDEESGQMMLRWPVEHVTVCRTRLAVGDSCYIITGHCVLCTLDDELDMVECTRCKRFTHFHCTYPQLSEPPQV